jgi:hypothetical protein
MYLRIRRAHSAAAAGEATAASTMAGRKTTSSPWKPQYPTLASGSAVRQRGPVDVPTSFPRTGRIVSEIPVSTCGVLVRCWPSHTTDRAATSSGVSFAGSAGASSALPVASNHALVVWSLTETRECALTADKRLSFLDGAQHLVHAEAPHLLGCDQGARKSVSIGFGL